MNIIFHIDITSKSKIITSNSFLRLYKQEMMLKFTEIKCLSRKLKKSELAKVLGCSSSTLNCYRNDINMLSPYRILPSNTRTKN